MFYEITMKKANAFYLNLERIMSGRGEIFTTPRSDIYQFRSWISDERKYYGKSLKTRDKQTALRKAEEEVLNITFSQTRGHSVFGITIKQLCKDWLREQKTRVSYGLIKDTRYKILEYRLNRWINPYLSSVAEKVNLLTRQSMMDYPMWRRNQVNGSVPKNITIKQECGIINSICKYAFNKSYIAFERMEYPKNDVKIEPSNRDWFSREEWKQFYRTFSSFVNDSKNDRDKYYRQLIRDFVLISANSCSRLGELRQVKWKNLSNRWIDKKMSDGSIQQRDIIEWNIPKEITKTNTSRKFVSRGGKYIERIRSYYQNEITGNAYVFCRYDSDSPITYERLLLYWRKLIEFSGIAETSGKNFVIYALRHYGITNRLRHGVSPYLVAKMSGTSLHFIEKHYEHLEMDIMRQSALMETHIDSEDDFLDD